MTEKDKQSLFAETKIKVHEVLQKSIKLSVPIDFMYRFTDPNLKDVKATADERNPKQPPGLGCKNNCK